jgi:hypothetical protein
MPVDPKLTEIAKRWSRMPRLRIAQGIDDAANDWPIGSFGEDEDTGKECWIATDSVHASDMVMGCTEIAEVLANAPDDVRVLIGALRNALQAQEGKE